ncbi:hypothetical protein [Teredinibacter sp. KSP-S5-2]|uniref:hypothetical protein n=1 Tax=Teredinibacter sp. KSP-S5-2 TaxID=3034506 RepID=UPI002934E3A2|nr:hypothetical protein [Teredinibacter sp. KSP-S5-2]WNO09849.1 hypothetical protein P5V12_01505 [Teredinibacter sp. KSP-S5-2]
MNRELILRISGTLAPDNKISLRTVSHTLPHLQRAIDKVVLYEKYGDLKKRSALPSSLYESADLFLAPFEDGSVKIPLVGNLLDGVGARLNQFLREPYDKAAKDLEYEYGSLANQLDNVRGNIERENVENITQEDLNAGANRLERSYAQTAVLKDINTMLSPLRAKSSVDDTIELVNNTLGKTANYSFSHVNAKTFGKIVTQKRLAKPVKYDGILEGLKRTGGKTFPCVGIFVSALTGQEMNLLFVSEMDAVALNKFNLSKKKFSIWACPLAVYESFDHLRGDIVFASLIERL